MPEFDDADVVAIDEAQFFPRLKKFVECGMYVNKNIIIAGLDADSSQRKIGEIIDCIPMACDVTKTFGALHAMQKRNSWSFHEAHRRRQKS